MMIRVWLPFGGSVAVEADFVPFEQNETLTLYRKDPQAQNDTIRVATFKSWLGWAVMKTDA